MEIEGGLLENINSNGIVRVRLVCHQELFLHSSQNQQLLLPPHHAPLHRGLRGRSAHQLQYR